MDLAITLNTIDATKLAVNAGNPQAMNVVMLGALSEYIPLREEELIVALSVSQCPRGFWRLIGALLNSERVK